MIFVKWSDKVEGSGDNIDAPLYGGLYKEEDNYLVPWSGKDPYAKINCFAWPREYTDWIVPGDKYNEEFKKWRGPIHNGQLCSQTLKEKTKTEEISSKFGGSTKFNGILTEGKPAIPIK